ISLLTSLTSLVRAGFKSFRGPIRTFKTKKRSSSLLGAGAFFWLFSINSQTDNLFPETYKRIPMQDLESLLTHFTSELNEIKKIPDLLNLKAKYLGKQGPISDVMKNLKDATPEEKRTIGAKANELKNSIEGLFAEKMQKLELEDINEKLSKDKIDISLTDSVMEKGLQAAGFHPVTLIQQEVEDIFISMGFDVLDGPHIEDEFHNFEALN